MSTGDSEAWRDSYDRWKLATPPEYGDEEEEPDRDDDHPRGCGCTSCREERAEFYGDYEEQFGELTDADLEQLHESELGEAGA